MDISEPCEDGRCYWDYLSEAPEYYSLDYYSSHYSCSGDRKDCLPVYHMCQGLSSCGDSQFCNEELSCAYKHEVRQAKTDRIKRLNTSQVQHYLCQYLGDEKDRSYNSIDRSDENITNTINIKESPMIDYNYLTPCDHDTQGPGVTCYGIGGNFKRTSNDRQQCWPVAGWCQRDVSLSCVTSQDGVRTATDDSRLCSNKTFWENVGTDFDERDVKARGVRCNGSLMHTIYPWYKYNNGEPYFNFKQNCEDQSDRVFYAGKPCPNRTYFLGVHNSEWCSTDPEIRSEETICTNLSAWLETTYNDKARLVDPHFCQESCATPGLNCVACSGDKFFNCSRSNTCIHPDLECDGHPTVPGQRGRGL